MSDDKIKELAAKEMSVEQRILRAMRKTLASVVRDATPRLGTSGFLSDDTVEQIKACFELIATRERELGDALGLAVARPVYPDQEQKAKAVQITRKKPGSTTH
ncbi:MAG: segregation and condensation protein A [Pseudomonadota bacterium]